MARKILGVLMICQFAILMLDDVFDLTSNKVSEASFSGVEIVLTTAFLFLCSISFMTGRLTFRIDVKTIFVVFSLLLMETIFLIFWYADLYSLFGIQNSDKVAVSDIGSCFYFSMMTWTTVGYGDLVPIGVSRAVAMCEAFSQYAIMALLIAAFVTVAQSFRDPAEKSAVAPSE